MPKAKKPITKQQKEAQLGQMLVNIYETGYLDRSTAYKMTFVKGLLAGLGGVIGATVVVALLLWILTFFNNIPLIGHVSENVKQTIEQK
ncbi:MAG: DUF5665 domain-containing protein [Candidatus Saccharimonadales bacterium]